MHPSMYITALFTIAKSWMQNKCLLTANCIKENFNGEVVWQEVLSIVYTQSDVFSCDSYFFVSPRTYCKATYTSN